MKKFISSVLIAVMALMVLSGCGKKETTIVVGAKDFTEQDIMGNILAILIEENSDISVDYKHEMSSDVVFTALKGGDIDIIIDYTGTVYGSYLGHEDVKGADEVYEISAKEIKEQFNLLMLDSLGFNNTYALAVRKDTAGEHGLTTYSDLAEVSDNLTLGATFEILNRSDGIPNLKAAYDMNFKEEIALDGTLRYTALVEDEVQVTSAFATDALLLEYDLAVLEDDKSFFPPYHAVTIIREDTAEEYPELLDILSALEGTMSDDTVRELNYKVDVGKENPSDVAREFLKNSGLIE